ncbi:hypothetical protein GCM10022384_67000 [Streptomyces marokkonensis]|uniref:Polysaccharide lyase 8 N-terminal alpha-helical domain-containing protein n=1 Tax=Streptomyces marokkonensis TaxID=324855 RepID=A0ABP7SKJ3_9ACTN
MGMTSTWPHLRRTGADRTDADRTGPGRTGAEPTRRSLLLTAALAAALAPALSAPTRAAAAADPYDTLRRRWLGITLGTGYDPAAEPYVSRLADTGDRARAHRATMAPTPTSLWPGHPFDPPAGITLAYGRLWTMTEAYVQQGTGSTGDETLLADILRGLDHLSATVYNPATTRYGNWWEWQIGSPRLLTDITAALYDHLGTERVTAACAAVDHFVLRRHAGRHPPGRRPARRRPSPAHGPRQRRPVPGGRRSPTRPHGRELLAGRHGGSAHHDGGCECADPPPWPYRYPLRE